MNDPEVWRHIEGWSAYAVSDLGRVRNLLSGEDLTGTVIRQKTGKIARIRVLLSLGGPRRQVSIHTLVLEAFAGPRPTSMEGCHGDGNPLNNRLKNLRWDTRKGNLADTVPHGTRLLGERCNGAKLTPRRVRRIRAQRAAGRTLSYLAERNGVTPVQIWNVCNGVSWNHIR